MLELFASRQLDISKDPVRPIFQRLVLVDICSTLVIVGADSRSAKRSLAHGYPLASLQNGGFVVSKSISKTRCRGPTIMGQTLSEPVTEKETDFEENDFIYYGVSSMQGWRISMEDAHAAELGFAGDDLSAFFGVYDGHGGTYQNVLQLALIRIYLVEIPTLVERESNLQLNLCARFIFSPIQGKVLHFTRAKCYTRSCWKRRSFQKPTTRKHYG